MGRGHRGAIGLKYNLTDAEQELRRLAAGDCGFYQMNDSALGESLTVGDSMAGAATSTAASTATGTAGFMRGVYKPGASTVTSAVRGLLRNAATRSEAMSLILGRRS